jgi:hypothetical protein
MGGHVAYLKKTRNILNIFVGKPQWKRSLGKPKSRCEYNIEIGLKK